MQVEKSRIDEIDKLHSEIIGHLKTSLEKAIRIGELLSEQKEKLNHGEFGAWIKDNLPFKERTARNYMRCFRERDRLKTASVADLNSAYKLLAEPKHDFKRLQRELDELDLIKDQDLQLKECVRIRNVATKWGQECAEEVLRLEVELGKIISEYEELYGEEIPHNPKQRDKVISRTIKKMLAEAEKVESAQEAMVRLLKNPSKEEWEKYGPALESVYDKDFSKLLYDHPPIKEVPA